MPNQMHAIVVYIDEDTVDHYLTPSSFVFRISEPIGFKSPSKTIGAIVRGYKGAVTKRLHSINFGGQVWHCNYHDHIICTEQSYQNISGYIIDNPKKWNEDKFHSKQ